MQDLINKLKKALENTLPGEDAQFIMAPPNRERVVPDAMQTANSKPSAVIILLCEDEDESIYIPLIERMPYKGYHSAQISLPGGKYEEGDKNLMNTAIRECHEEIGVNEIEVIGKLTPLLIPISNFMVHPYIGLCRVKNPLMTSHVREVKTILKLNVETLLNETTVNYGSIELNGLKIKTPYFDVESNKVWGATAMILSEFKELLRLVS